MKPDDVLVMVMSHFDFVTQTRLATMDRKLFDVAAPELRKRNRTHEMMAFAQTLASTDMDKFIRKLRKADAWAILDEVRRPGERYFFVTACKPIVAHAIGMTTHPSGVRSNHSNITNFKSLPRSFGASVMATTIPDAVHRSYDAIRSLMIVAMPIGADSVWYAPKVQLAKIDMHRHRIYISPYFSLNENALVNLPVRFPHRCWHPQHTVNDLLYGLLYE